MVTASPSYYYSPSRSVFKKLDIPKLFHRVLNRTAKMYKINCMVSSLLSCITVHILIQCGFDFSHHTQACSDELICTGTRQKRAGCYPPSRERCMLFFIGWLSARRVDYAYLWSFLLVLLACLPRQLSSHYESCGCRFRAGR